MGYPLQQVVVCRRELRYYLPQCFGIWTRMATENVWAVQVHLWFHQLDQVLQAYRRQGRHLQNQEQVNRQVCFQVLASQAFYGALGALAKD